MSSQRLKTWASVGQSVHHFLSSPSPLLPWGHVMAPQFPRAVRTQSDTKEGGQDATSIPSRAVRLQGAGPRPQEPRTSSGLP